MNEKAFYVKLTVKEASMINGGGDDSNGSKPRGSGAWGWLGRMAGRFNQIMTAAVVYGYEHAGLFH